MNTAVQIQFKFRNYRDLYLLIFCSTKNTIEYASPQIYLTWTYDPSLRMQGSSDFGPQTDPERSAEFMNSLTEEFMNSLSEEDKARLMSMRF